MTIPTAVITGAANGIGAGFARAAARRGMRVVLADLDDDACQALAAELKHNVDALSVRADVADLDDIERLANIAYGDDGEVVLLVNNAGIESGGLMWADPAAWRRTLEVNLNGVYHGIHVFVPRMLHRRSTAIVLNVASLGAFLTGPHQAAYQVSKHAVLALGECLTSDLDSINASIRVVTALPGAVATRIFEQVDEPADEESKAAIAMMGRAIMDFGMAPDTAAEIFLAAVDDGKTYVTTHPEIAIGFIRQRAEALERLATSLETSGEAP